MTVLDGSRIRHTVAANAAHSLRESAGFPVFTLRHPPESMQETDFIAAAERLAAIPGVEAFEVLREVSPKNGYRFGISMEFADSTAYAGYNDHPDHVRFVQERWVPEVADFLEVDYAPRAGE